jgi:hypothetical protein
MNKVSKFAKYLVGTAFFPLRFTEKWLQDSIRFRMGVIAWLFISILYGIATYIGGLNGLGAITTPFIPIPADDYYIWIGPFTPIIFLLVFIVLAGFIQLGSNFIGGKGAFEDTFVSVVSAFWLPTIITLWLFEMPVLVFFPSLRRSELGGLGYIPEWLDTGRQIVGLIWIIIVLILSIRIVHKISLPRSIILVIISMIPTTVVMLTYIR